MARDRAVAGLVNVKLLIFRFQTFFAFVLLGKRCTQFARGVGQVVDGGLKSS